MPKDPKPKITPPSPRLGIPLLVTILALFIIGVVLILVAKLVVAGVIALLGAVFGVSMQVSKNKNLKL